MAFGKESLDVKKRIYSILIGFLILVVAPVFSRAENAIDEYVVENGVVINYVGNEETIQVPEYINGVKIIAIGESAFKGNKNLREIALPDSVNRIGDSAFENCYELKKIQLSDQLEQIGDYSFSGCVSLMEINIPGTVKTIGSYQSSDGGYVFNKCSSLEKVVMNSGTEIIGDYAFYNCTGLKEVKMPDTIKIVGTWAFGFCEGIQEIELSDGLKEIESAAFYQCTMLNDVTMPESVEKIGTHSFRGCSSLSNLELSEKIQTIPFRAFSGCTDLKKIDLPEYLIKIDDEAFYQSGLESVVIPQGTQEIGASAFQECGSLKTVDIPDSVTYMGEKCFYGCGDLQNVRMSENVKIIPSDAFYNCVSLNEINIPSATEEIKSRAFYNCRGLKRIVLPEALKTIGESAYEKCTSLIEVLNKSEIKLEQGEKNNGCVAFYCLNVVKDSPTGTFQNQQEYEFYSLEGNNYLIGYVGESKHLELPQYFETHPYDIAPYAFYEKDIQSISIPKSVNKVGDYAFGGCVKLLSVVYEGTEAERNSIDFGDGNQDLTEKSWVYYKETYETHESSDSFFREIKDVFSNLISEHIFFLNFILTLFWGVIFLYSSRQNDNPNAYMQRKKIFIIIVCVQWILISGLRADTVGADTENYMRLFDQHSTWPWDRVLDGLTENYLVSGTDDYEPGYILLEKIISTITSSHLVYKFVIAIIFMAAFGYYVYKNSVDPCLSFVLYDGIFYNMFSLTGYRQTISVAIAVLFGYKFVKARKFVPFIITVLIAALFHRSILIIIPFYFIANKKQTIPYIVTVITMVVALIAVRNPMFQVVKGIVGYEQYSGTYGFAQQTFVALLIILTCVVYYFKDQILRRYNTAVQYYNGLILAWFMVPFAMVSPTSMRLVYNFAFVLVLLVPALVNSFRKATNRYIVYWAIIIVFGYFILTRSPEYMFYWQ